MDNKREHKRTPLKVQLRIDHPAHGQMLVTTRDISESGVFVVIDDAQKLLRSASWSVVRSRACRSRRRWC